LNYCVRAESVREKYGGWIGFISEKEKFCLEKDIEGIFLYDVKSLYQEVMGEGMEIIYYIRFDYIK